MLGEHKNSLALLARASELSTKALPVLSSLQDASASSPPNISISSSEAQGLASILQGQLQRHRALVELSNLTSKPQANNTTVSKLPLVERLNTYPSDGVDLTNLVTYPPKLEPIPVKPLFFDVAWNYIQYPGHKATKDIEIPSKANVVESAHDQTAQQKKGWFGFGR